MEQKVCRECGKPSEKAYCSKLCANRYWRKSKTYKQKTCVICGKPARETYCSLKCAGASREKSIHTAICSNPSCGKEFTFDRISYLKRGQMKFCSRICANTRYSVNDTFFTHYPDISAIYQTLGFLFSNGFIYSYKDFEIELRSPDKEKLEKFKLLVNSTYPIKYFKKLKEYNTIVRSKTWLEYLSDIGLSSNLNTHTFPTILEEYKIDFIKGYMTSELCKIHKNNTIDIKAESYPLIREVALVTGGDLVTKHLAFHCLIKGEMVKKLTE